MHTTHIHQKISLDNQPGVQKSHNSPIPRIGGLMIFTSMIITSLLVDNLNTSQNMLPYDSFLSGLIVASFVVFLGGFTEDITKALSPNVRLMFMISATFVSLFLTKTIMPINNTNFIVIDAILQNPFASLCLTLFAVVGLSNAYNIIDGFNGLSASSAICSLLTLFLISQNLHDIIASKVALVLIGAIFGFLLFNYPKAKIFLGDGGAYVIGFIICLLNLKFVQDNSQNTSLWLMLLLQIYPITEIGFSIIRRKFIFNQKSTQPDRLHLHHLIHDKLVHKNYRVMPILLILFMLPQILFSLVFYNNYLYLIFAIIAYIIYYATMYTLLYNYKKNKIHD